MTAPRVYKSINAVARDLSLKGIAKANTHPGEGYQYRSIDDVMGRLSPLLAKHRLCVLPRVIERISDERTGLGASPISVVALKVAFDLVSVHDASIHTIEICAEAFDDSDKATSKALSAAYKSAMLQTFCIPVAGLEDPDSSSLKLGKPQHQPEPVQGWHQWSEDIQEMLSICVTEEALNLVQSRNRTLLASLGRERPDLYKSVGNTFVNAKSALSNLGEHSPSALAPVEPIQPRDEQEGEELANA